MQVQLGLLSVLLALCYCDETPDGYVLNPDSGIAYRVEYTAQSWPIARDLCEEDGGKLAVPKSEAEFSFIQKLVRGIYHPAIRKSQYRMLLWLGIHNLDNYKIWENIDGENIEETGFHKWAGENGQGFSDAPEEPHCAGVDAFNPGLRDFWCHRRLPYLCQINLYL